MPRTKKPKETRRREIEQALAAGLEPQAVAERTGLSVTTVLEYISRFRLRPKRLHGRLGFVQTVVEPDVSNRIEAEAARRKMSKRDLIGRVLTMVARDNLFEAVIGGGE